MMSKHKQVGMTLVELLIAITLGLIVTAAVIGLFTSVLSSNNTSLNAIRLNQELRTIMTLIARDIRRAGYNGNIATDITTNPFSTSSGTELTISNNGQTVMFAYDVDNDGSLGTDKEVFGYRYNSTDQNVQYCSVDASTACGWQVLSDSDVVEITNLRFYLIDDEGSSGAVERVRQVKITLEGHWKNDSDFEREIVESVKLRNEHFTEW
jgi:Tfp pilus assembly protein PilW